MLIADQRVGLIFAMLLLMFQGKRQWIITLPDTITAMQLMDHRLRNFQAGTYVVTDRYYL